MPPGTVKVKCKFCNKSFYKDKGHYNENLKLGHSFFCSKTCEGESRSRQIVLACERPLCTSKFSRTQKNISLHNYCSQTCAAVVNNQKFPKWPKRYCVECRQKFKNRDSKYCSSKCGEKHWLEDHRSKYTHKQIIYLIKKYYNKNKRTPAKREIVELTNRVPKIFGSWNNAIEAAGLIPNRSHDHRMYKRTKTKASDGHTCDSISEALVDNWLTQNKIHHIRDYPYPGSKHKADWAIFNGKIFIEYFGLAKDSPRYDRNVQKKKLLCQKHNIKLISIYPEDLYPARNLDARLATF